MPNLPFRAARRLPLLLLLLTLFSLGVRGQSPLDVGIHFSPQLRYLSSSDRYDPPASGSYTRGLDGLSMAAGGGVYLEYEVTPHWFVRSGIDLSYKRNRYAVERVFIESDSVVRGSNQIVFTSIEVPLAIIYRFDYLNNGDSYLLGVATTLTRNTGMPRAFTSFADRGSAKDKISYPAHSLTVFGGYEHNLSPSVIVGVEPYLSYVPTRFDLERTTTTTVRVEAGLSLRLRLDN
ncbi:hypothetical protein [Lewinella sp. IMCC34183]|uniref:hypothetical protein n=1 Tax=Lewinella sp. IMCC34183 TaxID=2248762 RepID=UPI000E2740EE|nr:hypothetical protein [Lewinella sp. IMCC34183]